MLEEKRLVRLICSSTGFSNCNQYDVWTAREPSIKRHERYWMVSILVSTTGT